jgi:hypothetical protein
LREVFLGAAVFPHSFEYIDYHSGVCLDQLHVGAGQESDLAVQLTLPPFATLVVNRDDITKVEPKLILHDREGKERKATKHIKFGKRRRSTASELSEPHTHR